MFRSGASRVVSQAFQPKTAQSARLAFSGRAQWSSKLCTMAAKRPTAFVPVASKTLSLVRYESNVKNVPNPKLEHALQNQEIPSDPSTVSTTSSVHPITSEIGTPQPEKDIDMLAGIKSELKTIKETFNLEAVPKQAYYVGLAGVVPYLATSLTTVYCAAEINANAIHGTGYLMSGKSADLLLQIVEPMQVGYGAVIISFLGAIHWGLEWAGYGGTVGYRRYAIGVLAPAIAWPTILLSPWSALTAQFLAFTMFYYVDANATKRGWTPPWYAMYRFVLTFVVGAAIVISLTAKGKIMEEHSARLPNPIDRIRRFKDNAAEELAAEERAHFERIHKEAEELKEEAE